MKNILLISILLILLSCSKNKDYQMINSFLKTNNIKLKNLSSEPYHIESSLQYWKEKEFTDLNFTIKKNEKYKIDTSLIRNKIVNKSEFYHTTNISLPLISDDAKKALIAIKVKRGVDEDLTIYLLENDKNGWTLKTSISSIKTVSH